MTFKTLMYIIAGMGVAMILNIAVSFGTPISGFEEPVPIEREEAELGQAQQIASYLTSFNSGKGAYHYHLEAGCKDPNGFMPELYIQFKIHDLVCKDCNDMLKYEIIPMLCLIGAKWEEITGTKVINLVNSEDRLMWIYFEYNKIMVHDPYLSEEYANVN